MRQAIRILMSALISGGAFCGTLAACQASQIFWASDPVGPNETVLVVGDGFQDVIDLRVRRLADNAALSETSDWVHARRLQQNERSLKFTIPEDFEPGVYRYELIEANGSSVLGDLNTPSVYWAQGDQGTTATPGGWVRVLGRNIATSGNARLRLFGDQAGPMKEIRPTSWSRWDATFQIPASAPAGAYELRLWNGSGDASAWRMVGKLEFQAGPRPPSHIVNIKNAGASGDGKNDDTAVVQMALKDLGRRGGGILFFPRGYYRFTGALTVPKNVTVKGESRELTRFVWEEMESPPRALIEGYTNFALEDVTIFASNHKHVISGGFAPSRSDPPGKDITIRRVTVRASMYRGHLGLEEVAGRMRSALTTFKAARGPDTLRLSGTNLVVEDSDIYGSARAMFLLEPRRARIVGNTFYNGRRGWYSITSADGVIFEGNRVVGSDLQASGGSINTLSGEGSSASRNVLFRGNRFEMMNGWDREAMTSDGGGGCYQGHVTAGYNDREFILSDPVGEVMRPMNSCRGAAFLIVGGHGMGQYAEIAHVDEQSIRLDRALAVMPDSSSMVSIAPLQMNYLMIENEFSDAGVAIQFYGSSIGHVVAGNSSRRTGGFQNRGLQYQGGLQPNWYIQYLGNEIREGDTTGDAMIRTWAARKADVAAPLVLGTIIRRNVLAGNAHIEVKGVSEAFSGVEDVIIENNTVHDANVGIVVDAGARGVLLRENRFESVSQDVVVPSVANSD